MNKEKIAIGVYICHCGVNIAAKVDVEAVRDFAKTLDHVADAKEYKFMCSSPGQELIMDQIKTKGINRVVVASCSPRMHEPTFRRACESAGISKFYFQMANIRENASWVTLDPVDATRKAKELVAAAVARVAYHRELSSRKVGVHKSVMVVGGGIAGMQAALTAAESDFKVCLVERQPTIGGNMARFDKTFPTLDCAACIGTPKMVQTAQHPNIELMTYSELHEVSGFVGNYKVKVRKKARYVNENCTGCGECLNVCPVDLPSEWDMGLQKRKAIFRAFPQAVPITFTIDKRSTAPCRTHCPAKTNVQGYVQMVKQGKYQEALNIIMERLPLPGVLGRVCPHPCESECRRALVDSPVAIRDLKRVAADHGDLSKVPVPDVLQRDASIAVIGSGPAGLTAAYYLRRKGFQITIFEAMKTTGGMLRSGIPDYRLPPAVLDQEIDHILSLGIELKTGKTLGRDFTIQDLKDQGYQAVFLGIGAHGPVRLNIENEDASGVMDAVPFLWGVNLDDSRQIDGRVVVIGGGNVAMDAARVAMRCGAESVTVIYRRTEFEMPADHEEINGAKEEGIAFIHLATPVRVMTEEGRATGIQCIKNELGTPDKSGRQRPVPIKGSEFVIPCDHIIPAIGQVPMAQSVCQGTGIELTSWGTFVVDPETLETNEPGVFAAGDAVTGPATVVEAVAAGLRAVAAIENYLSKVSMAEKTPERDLAETDDRTPDYNPVPEDTLPTPRAVPELLRPEVRKKTFEEVDRGLTLEAASAEAQRCINCGGCCECMQCVDACLPGAVTHSAAEEIVEREIGSIIFATGFDPFDPTPLKQYGFGRYPEVYTSLQFERLNNATGPTSGKILMKNGKPPKRVAIIHCVGSRDRRHNKYCSRVCCMYSLKFAHLIKDKTDAEVWQFYIDMRSPGKLYEEFYNRVQEEAVHMIRGKVAEITDIPDDPKDLGRLTVVAENTLTSRNMRLPVDMVILSVGLNPAMGSEDTGRLAGVQTDSDGWFTELHAKLGPVSTPTAGIFLAGCCQGPKDIPDTVAQASAAAGEAVSVLAKGSVETRAEISQIDPDLCSGCRTCLGVCAYSAISFDESRMVAVVNDALCQGCGSCAAACPSSAAKVGHFTDKQVMQEMEALLL